MIDLPTIFPAINWKGRTSVSVMEFAAMLDITANHVINLIEEGSLRAFDCSSGPRVSKRRLWRIALIDIQAFIVARSSLADRERALDAKELNSKACPVEGQRISSSGESGPLQGIATRFATAPRAAIPTRALRKPKTEAKTP